MWFSAALRCGLIEAGFAAHPLLPAAHCFPQHYAAASLKLYGEPCAGKSFLARFPQHYAAASLKQISSCSFGILRAVFRSSTLRPH